MNVKFELKQPTTDWEENIVIEGKTVGAIRPYALQSPETCPNRFQAAFPMPGYSLAAGFGPTREEAIRDALQKAITNGEETLRHVANLLKALDNG